MAAWESAEAWKSVKDKSDAEDRILGRPKSLKPSSFIQTRRNVERVHGELTDPFVPARALVEAKCQDINNNNFVCPRIDNKDFMMNSSGGKAQRVSVQGEAQLHRLLMRTRPRWPRRVHSRAA